MRLLVAFLILLLPLASADAQRKYYNSDRKANYKESYDNIEKVRIETISADCQIRVSDNDQVEFSYTNTYQPGGSAELEARESHGSLKLEEVIMRSNSGHAELLVRVPKHVEIDFQTASGDFQCHGVTGDLDLSSASGHFFIENASGEVKVVTASGQVELVTSNGYVDISTASGEVTIDRCTGQFEIATASGDIEASGIETTGASDFSTASGNSEVILGATPRYDLHVSSASGRSLVEYDGNELAGRFELLARERYGRIRCSESFDSERVFRKWGDKYDLKSFERGGESPLIVIETASGTASLER